VGIRSEYYLKNKDIIVADIAVDREEVVSCVHGKEIKELIERVVFVNVRNEELLPVNLKDTDRSVFAFETWLKERKLPGNRKFYDVIANSVFNPHNVYANLPSLRYIDVGAGFSLNDTYWIQNIAKVSATSWKMCNLYDNPFDSSVEKIAFTGYDENEIRRLSELIRYENYDYLSYIDYLKIKMPSSPEYTTNGALKKAWHRDQNGDIFLMKGSGDISSIFGGHAREPYAEFYSSQLGIFLGLNCIKYDIEIFHDMIASKCPIFTSKEESFVPLQWYFSRHFNNVANKDELLPVADSFGLASFEDMMVFDAIICNRDRHLKNFGVMVNADTNERLGSAPIFDNGLSAINDVPASVASNEWFMHHFRTERGYFGFTFEEQLKLYTQPRHLSLFEKLSIFKFERNQQFTTLPEKILSSFEAYLNALGQIGIKVAQDAKMKQQSKCDSKIIQPYNVEYDENKKINNGNNYGM